MYVNIFLLLFSVFIFLGCSDAKDKKEVVKQDETQSRAVYLETKVSNWYVDIIAEDRARGLESHATQLGAINAPDAAQKHSLKTFAPFDGLLDVLVVNPHRLQAGEYRTNYHVFKTDIEDRWSFSVKCDNPNAEIVLSWRGLYVLAPYEDSGRQMYKSHRSVTNPLLKQMKLVDKKNGVEVQAVRDGRLALYVFNMDGNISREFEWVVATSEVIISRSVRRSLSLRATKLVDHKKSKEVFKEKQDVAFDLLTPPSMSKDRR